MLLLILGILCGLIVISFGMAMLFLYLSAYYHPPGKRPEPGLIPDNVYGPYKEELLETIEEIYALPYEDVWIKAGDGCRLHGKLFNLYPGNPV